MDSELPTNCGLPPAPKPTSRRRTCCAACCLTPVALALAGIAAIRLLIGPVFSWHIQNPKVLSPAELPVCSRAGSESMAVLADGRTVLVACGGETLEWWDLATRRKTAAAPLPRAGKGHWAIDRSGTQISLEVDEGSDRRYALVGRTLRALPTRTDQHAPTPFEAGIDKTQDQAHRFSPDGKWMLTDTGDPAGAVQFWQTGKTAPTHTDKAGSGVLCIDFSPDGICAAVGTHRAGAVVWRLSDGKILGEVEGMPGAILQIDGDHVLDVRFSPDSSRLAVGRLESGVELWDWRHTREVAECRAPVGAHNRVAFALGATMLVSWGGHGRVFTWDIKGL